MTAKPSREDVLRLAHEFECIDEQHYGSEWTERLERFAAAMYAAGAEDMRERAKEKCDQLARLYTSETVGFDKAYTMAATRASAEIGALPITPTNTEGEQ